jgi:hypothetical protein
MTNVLPLKWSAIMVNVVVVFPRPGGNNRPIPGRPLARFIKCV